MTKHGLAEMWLPASLKNRLLALIALAALPVAAGMAVMILDARSTALTFAKHRLLQDIAQVRIRHSETSAVAHKALSILAQLPEITEANQEKCADVLKPIVGAEDLLFNFTMFGLDGNAVCSGRENAPTVNIADRPYFQRAVRARAFVAGDFQMGRVTRQPSMSFALPILGDSGAPHLVLLANALLSTLIDPISLDSNFEGETITLIDPAFTVLLRSPPDKWAGKSITGTEMHRVLARNDGDSAVEFFPGLMASHGIHAFTALRDPLGHVQGYAVVSLPEAAVLAPVNAALIRGLALLVLTVLGMTVIAYAGTDVFVLKRVDGLIKAIRRIAAGDFTARMPARKDHNEFTALETAFNEMATKNESSMENVTRLNRIYILLSAVNSAIVQIREPKALAIETSRIVVELGGYLSSSIFLIDWNSRVARAVGHAGTRKDHYESLAVHFDGPVMEGDGPMTIMFKTGRHVVEAVDHEAPEGKPMSRALRGNLEIGGHSIAAFPLMIEGRVIGALQLCSSNPHAFGEEEVRLLLQLSADVALGFDHIEKQKQVGASEKRFRDTFNQAAVGIAHVSPEGRFLWLNGKFANIVGYTPEEMLAKTFQELTYPDDLGAETTSVQRLLRQDIATYSLEKRYLRHDGSVVWVNVTMSLVRKVDGTPRYFVSVIEDISTRKAAETMRDQLAAIVENSNDAIYSRTLDGAILSWNPGAEKLLGYPAAEVMGKSVDLIVPPGREAQRARNNEKILRGETIQARESTRLTRDGRVIDVIVSNSPIRDAAGKIIGASVILKDITEYKRAQDALCAAEEQFRGLVEQSIAGIYIIQDGKLTYVNPRFAEIFGYASVDELIGRDALSVVAENERVAVAGNIREWLKGVTRSISYSTTALRKDGSTIDVGVHASRGKYDDQPAIIGMLQDISEKKRADEEIKRYVAQLETAFMSTVEVATTLSEMRDPYTTGHERRVAEIAVAIGAELGLDRRQQEGLRVAGHLHDVGKITIPSEILSKPGKLSAIEFQLVQGHCQASYDVLKSVEFPWPVAQIALQHHERMDGSGYPQGLKGEAILLEARIMAVADVVEAMSSHRPYRPGLGIDKALAEIERGSGTAYDADVVDACLRLFRTRDYQLPV